MENETSLEAVLRRRIAQDGPISIAQFMAAALYDPANGYYTTRDSVGGQGDFTTAPEISQIFGELIGLWAAATWQSLGSPERIRLVELGPGRGTLMSDALRAARVLPGFLHAVDLHLVEISPHLREIQRDVLEGSAVEPHWFDAVSALPETDNVPTLYIANEFFDALPIRQMQKTQAGWRERLVDVSTDDSLHFVVSEREDAATALMSMAGMTTEAMEENSIVEFCPAGQALIADIAGQIARGGGAALILDYGYAPSGPGDTLQALRSGKPSFPLIAPGEADLTAHVDFAALARTAEAEGLTAHGPSTQSAFLCRLGIEARLEALCQRADAAAQERLRSGVARLIEPDQMGTLFKVLALTPEGQAAIGF
ncbi:MAG: SAM-dependent methyltransferase [Pseudomonadota bacterium]